MLPNNKKELQISHSTLKISEDEYLINLAINTQNKECKSNYFVCCIDVSGSMNDASSTDLEASKFSRWDLVKHSITTIISSLGDNDQLSVITFSNDAKLKIPFTKMDKNGRMKTIEQLNKIEIGGGTNLWAGLKTTLELINDKVPLNSESNVHALVLTDGESNQNPQLGVMHEYMQKFDSKPIKAPVSTFGYGYGLDSKLLKEISDYSGGFFNHVPDHSMCNSVFINYLSNCLAASINKVEVQVPEKIECISHAIHKKLVKLGTVQEGQAQNIIFKAKLNDPKNSNFTFNLKYEGLEQTYKINSIIPEENFQKINLKDMKLNNDQLKHILSSTDFGIQYPKNLLMQIINKVLNDQNLNHARDELDLLYQSIEHEIDLANENEIKDKLELFLKDIKSGETNEGQIYKAVSNGDWFKKWGVHYLRYFVASHQFQSCTNFKDSSLQSYGGNTFKEIKNKVEDIFSKITIPKPSRSKTEYTGNYQKTFYCKSGGCVDGLGRVETKSGLRLVKELKKGDVIINSDGQFDTIVCVLKRKVEAGYMDMLSINGMKITPWHPLRLTRDDKWEFPVNVSGYPLKINCDYIYNFVLEKHHFITINGVDVITLGHGYTHDCLLHPFFGTQKVIQQLKTHSGWENGLIEYKYNPSHRNDLVSSLW